MSGRACLAFAESENASKTTTFYSHTPDLWTTLDKLGFPHIVDSMPYDFSKNLGITKDLRRHLFTLLMHNMPMAVSACLYKLAHAHVDQQQHYSCCCTTPMQCKPISNKRSGSTTYFAEDCGKHQRLA